MRYFYLCCWCVYKRIFTIYNKHQTLYRSLRPTLYTELRFTMISIGPMKNNTRDTSSKTVMLKADIQFPKKMAETFRFPKHSLSTHKNPSKGRNHCSQAVQGSDVLNDLVACCEAYTSHLRLFVTCITLQAVNHMGTKSKTRQSWGFQMVYMMQLDALRAHTGKPDRTCGDVSQRMDSPKHMVGTMSQITCVSNFCCVLQIFEITAVHHRHMHGRGTLLNGC